MVFILFFNQKTLYEMRISDWSSDVCSSDLPGTWVQTSRVRSAKSSIFQACRPMLRFAAMWHAMPTAALPPAHQRTRTAQPDEDRKSVGSGKSVSVRVDLGCRRDIQKKTSNANDHSVTTNN